MLLVQKWPFLQLFFLVNIGQENESNPPPNLEIRLNNVSLGFFKNNTFTLQDVNMSYGGTYECVPWNMFGYGPIATVNLTV